MSNQMIKLSDINWDEILLDYRNDGNPDAAYIVVCGLALLESESRLWLLEKKFGTKLTECLNKYKRILSAG